MPLSPITSSLEVEGRLYPEEVAIFTSSNVRTLGLQSILGVLRKEQETFTMCAHCFWSGQYSSEPQTLLLNSLERSGNNS